MTKDQLTNPWFPYKTQKEWYNGTSQPIRSPNKGNPNKVSKYFYFIEGVRYDCMSDVLVKYKMSERTIRRRCDNKLKWVDWIKVAK